MNKSLLLAAAAILLAPAAFAADASEDSNAQVNYKDNGGYTAEHTTNQTTSTGVMHTSDDKTDVDYDSHGNMKKTVAKKDVTKAGVLHKKTNTSKSTYKQNKDGSADKSVTLEHTNTDGTNLKTVEKTHAAVDANGNVVTTTKTQNTIDPPGLLNKTTTTTDTKAINGAVIDTDTK